MLRFITIGTSKHLRHAEEALRKGLRKKYLKLVTSLYRGFVQNSLELFLMKILKWRILNIYWKKVSEDCMFCSIRFYFMSTSRRYYIRQIYFIRTTVKLTKYDLFFTRFSVDWLFWIWVEHCIPNNSNKFS